MEAKEWKLYKRLGSVIAALFLLGVSSVGFSTGLSFGGEYGSIIGLGLWFALTIIQLIGNDKESWNGDTILFLGWMFSYILGIGSDTWAFYSWINIPVDWLRWLVCFGLGGVVEILPEKLIIIFLKSLKDTSSRPNGITNKPDVKDMMKRFNPTQPPNGYKPSLFPNQNKPKQNNFQPQHRPNFNRPVEPTYNSPKAKELERLIRDDKNDRRSIKELLEELEGGSE